MKLVVVVVVLVFCGVSGVHRLFVLVGIVVVGYCSIVNVVVVFRALVRVSILLMKDEC